MPHGFPELFLLFSDFSSACIQSLPNKTHLWAVDVSLYLAVYIVTSCYRILKLFARDAHLRRLSKMVGHLPFTIV